jgi:PAS domain S-box-containing protein
MSQLNVVKRIPAAMQSGSTRIGNKSLEAGSSILIVEDEALVAEDLRVQLEHAGYFVVATVASGEAALELLQGMQVDLVLMDIVIQGSMDGIETAGRIRELYEVPVVYITAFTDRAKLERAKLTEPYGYLIKPFDERELQTTIEVALYKNSMDRALRERERWHQAVLQSIGDAVITSDHNGHISYLNPVAERLTGFTLEQAAGQNLQVVFNVVKRDQSDSPLDFASWAQQGQQQPRHGMYLLLGQTGAVVAVDATVSSIANNKGVFSGVIVTFQDVTQRVELEQVRKRAFNDLETLVAARTTQLMALNANLQTALETGSRIQNELSQAKLQAEAANVAKSQFLAIISHELRTPLNAIIGFSQLLEYELKDAGQQDMVKSVSISGNHLLRMVDEILEFSDMDKGDFLLGRTPFDLYKLAKNLGEWGTLQAAEKNLEFGIEIQGIKHAAVVGDEDKLHRVVQILLDNAIKFTGQGKVSLKISNTIAKDGTVSLIFEVTDTGVGIESEKMSKIFERFAQGDITTTRKFGGLGLGLAIAERLVKLMNGKIEVRSEKGRGSTFTLSVSLAAV